MRVKISYGTEIEDVPEEAAELFKYVFEQKRMLLTQLEAIDTLFDIKDTKASVEVMEKARESLAKMDSRISDVISILKGYNGYLDSLDGGEHEVSDGGSSLDSTSDSSVQTQQ